MIRFGRLFALARRQAGPTLRAIRAGTLHLDPQRGFRQIEVAGNARNGLAIVEDQAHRLGFEVFIESPAWPARA